MTEEEQAVACARALGLASYLTNEGRMLTVGPALIWKNYAGSWAVSSYNLACRIIQPETHPTWVDAVEAVRCQIAAAAALNRLTPESADPDYGF